MSRPTVYRTLSELVDAGLLRSMTLGGRTVYEHDYGYPQHDHLHCQKCNKLIEFHSDEVAQIGEALARQYQFRVTGHRLIFSGICADCRVTKAPHAEAGFGLSGAAGSAQPSNSSATGILTVQGQLWAFTGETPVAP